MSTCPAQPWQVDIQDPTLKLGLKIVQRAVKESKVILVEDTSCSEDYLQSENTTGIATRSIVCAPLIINGETIGAVELINNAFVTDGLAIRLHMPNKD